MVEIKTVNLIEFLTSKKQSAQIEALRAAQTYSSDESLERRAMMCRAEIRLLDEVLEFIEPGSAAKTPSIRICYKNTGKSLDLGNGEKICFRCGAEFNSSGFITDPCFVTSPPGEIGVPPGPGSTFLDY